jgi:hypothetical protein
VVSEGEVCPFSIFESIPTDSDAAFNKLSELPAPFLKLAIARSAY